jgi:hypothetical protein
MAAGTTFNGVVNQRLFESGDFLFRGSVIGANSGFWSSVSGSLTPLAVSGSQAPGMPAGDLFRIVDTNISANASGQVAFRGFPNTAAQGIWSQKSGSLSVVALSNQQAPGTPNGFVFLGFGSPAIDDQSHIAVLGTLQGTAPAASDRGIWREDGSGLHLVALKGDQPSGAGTGVRYLTFSDPLLNGQGQLAFAGTLSGAGVTLANDRGIWSDRSGSMQLLWRTGDQAAGVAPGISYSSFDSIRLNGNGQMAFLGGLAGSGVTSSTDHAIWGENNGGALRVVAREGDPAPGLAAGFAFGSFGFISMNDVGQVVLDADLSGPGLDLSNNHGIWATDRNGVLRLLARYGDMFEVAPGDSRRIQWLRYTGLSISGQILFSAHFTDGTSGIFVSDAFAVPEPAASGLLVSAALGALSMRRRRTRSSNSPPARC